MCGGLYFGQRFFTNKSPAPLPVNNLDLEQMTSRNEGLQFGMHTTDLLPHAVVQAQAKSFISGSMTMALLSIRAAASDGFAPTDSHFLMDGAFRFVSFDSGL